jgi:hypothetical protein
MCYRNTEELHAGMIINIGRKPQIHCGGLKELAL